MANERLQRVVLRLFRRVSRTSLWFETRFTGVGRLTLGGAVVAAIFGIDPRQTFAFQLAALLGAIVAVAMLFSLRWRPRLEFERLLPDTVTVGVETEYRIAVTNRGTRIETGLVVVDRLLTRYPDADEFRHPLAGEREAGLNWFDRRVGFPRWLELLRKNRGGKIEAEPLPPIRPGDTIQLRVAFTPLRRGKIVFDAVVTKRPDPMGVFYAISRYDLYGELISLPQRFPVPRLQWQSERHFHPGGLTLATTVGDSEEFVGLREYRPGDPLRHIHWRSFARLGKPVVKEHQDEYFDRHALLIDTFAADSTPEEFETAVAVAASLIQSDRPSDSILDLVFIDGELWQLTTGRGLSNNRQILMQLAELKPASTDEFEHLADYAKQFLERLASVVVVCTAWDAKREAFVQELRHRRVRSLVLKIGESSVDAVAGDPAAGDGGRAIHTIRPAHTAADLGDIAAPVSA